MLAITNSDQKAALCWCQEMIMIEKHSASNIPMEIVRGQDRGSVE